MKAPSDMKSYMKAVRSIGDAVAEKLGNTRSVALSSYIAPQVFSGWKMAAGVTASASVQLPDVYYGEVTAPGDFRDKQNLFDDDDSDTEKKTDPSVVKMLGFDPADMDAEESEPVVNPEVEAALCQLEEAQNVIEASPDVLSKIKALPNAPEPTGKWTILRKSKERQFGKGNWKKTPIHLIEKPPDALAFKMLPVKVRDKMVDDAPVRSFDPRELVTNQPVVQQKDLEHFYHHGEDPEPVIVLKTKAGLYIHNGNHRTTVAMLSGKRVDARYIDLSQVQQIKASTPAEALSALGDALTAYSEDQPRDEHGRWAAGDTNTDRTVWHFDDLHPDEKINGVPLKPDFHPDFDKLTNPDLKEGPLKVSPGQHAAAGVIMIEPDNKVWVVTPDNYYGGYRNTFAKGTQDQGEALQKTAVRETYEESGLLAKITGVLGDVQRSTSATRYYIGERVGGSPAMAGEETYAVKLMDLNDPKTDERMTGADGKPTADADVLSLIRDHLGIQQPAQEAPTSSGPLSAAVIMHEKVGSAQGSNVGGFYKGSDGVDRYVKLYNNPEQAHGEALANTVYRDLGVNAPNSHVFDLPNGKQGFASDIISGGKTLEDTGLTKDNAREVLKGFAADVLTANWDAVGLTYDNILLKGGEAHRIDNGSSFLYRAQGGQKPASLLNQATEIKNFFNHGINHEYAALTKKAGYSSASELPGFRSQVKSIVALQQSSGGWDKYLSDKAPYLSDGERSKISGMLTARTKALSDAAEISASSATMKLQCCAVELQCILAGMEF
jgi:ADP-ribose pyrophosphatase YjhB (NUDIX family)